MIYRQRQHRGLGCAKWLTEPLGNRKVYDPKKHAPVVLKIGGSETVVISVKRARRNRGTLPRRRRLLFERDSRCYWCGDVLEFQDSTVDHVLPLNHGGTNRMHNLALACESCNNSKGGKLVSNMAIPYVTHIAAACRPLLGTDFENDEEVVYASLRAHGSRVGIGWIREFIRREQADPDPIS